MIDEGGGGPFAVLPGDRDPPDFEMTLLEPRPFRPFKSSEEYLYAMKEDLAEWLNGLYGLSLDADNFLDQMETGVVLCQHANNVVRKAREYYRSGGAPRPGEGARAVPDRGVVHRRDVAPETFHARDNVHNFIAWCRGALGVRECLLFETDDLVLRKNERNVVLCLLEVARRGVQFGLPAPLLVQLEQEIDAEIADDDDGYETMRAPAQQVVTNDLRSLHERVVELLSRCNCPSQFPMIRVADGKYRIGDTKVLIFVRILRSHVMVRVGGGWDTLAHYLDKHDPCRCRSGHRLATSAKLTMLQGKSAIPNMHVTYTRPTQVPTSSPSSPLAARRTLQPHTSPLPPQRSAQHHPASPPKTHHHQHPPSDDSSTSSLQDTLERNRPRQQQRMRSRASASKGPNSSSEDEDGSAEEAVSLRRAGTRVSAPSSWKYSPGGPGVHQSAPVVRVQQHTRRVSDGSSCSRLPTPQSEKRPPPKVGKVAPRLQQPPQPWTDHRSQSSENLNSLPCQGQSQPRTVVFHSRGPSPVGPNRSRQVAENNGFRRSDPKRHTSPRMIQDCHQGPPRTRLSPPRFVSKPRTLPVHQNGQQQPAPSRTTPVQSRRLFWSPERPRPLASRKNSAPSLDGGQLPVIEKLQRCADLCADREFLDKIEQLIEEFQAKTRMTPSEDDHRSGGKLAYASLPATLRSGTPLAAAPRNGWDGGESTLKNGSNDGESHASTTRNVSEKDESPAGRMRNGSEKDESPAGRMRNGSGIEESLAGRMRNGSGNGESPAARMRNGNETDESPAARMRNGSGNGESPAGRMRNGSGNDESPAARMRNGIGNDESPAARMRNGSGNDESPAARMRNGSGNGESPAARMRNGSETDESPAARMRNGSGNSESPTSTLRNGCGNEESPTATGSENGGSPGATLREGCQLATLVCNSDSSESPLKKTGNNGEFPPASRRNSSGRSESKPAQRRSPVETGQGKSPSRIPLPVWSTKYQS